MDARMLLMLCLVSTLVACASGPQSTPDIIRPPPVTASTLDRYPKALPPPASAKGPVLLADHQRLGALYHELRAEAETWVAWMLAPPPGESPRTGGGGDR